jgi:hypothetical protein
MTKLNDIFPEEGRDAALKLWKEDDSRHLVRKAIGKHLLSDTQIIGDKPQEQIMMILSQAMFAESEDECMTISKMIFDLHKAPDIFPMISEHQGYALASRCLISLSLFPKALEERSNRRGYPKPKFYRQIGKATFEMCDYYLVASHFSLWEDFIGKVFSD